MLKYGFNILFHNKQTTQLTRRQLSEKRPNVCKHSKLMRIIWCWKLILTHVKYGAIFFNFADCSAILLCTVTFVAKIIELKAYKPNYIPDHLFLPDWLPPLIFVRFSSNFLSMCTTIGAHAVHMLKKFELNWTKI